MRNPAVPFALLAVVVAATFGLAQWHPFSASAPGAASGGAGDVASGMLLFAGSCAGCHGEDGEGGVGPTLRRSGLTAPEVAAVVATGRGVMPAGLVEGADAADVAAFVASIAE